MSTDITVSISTAPAWVLLAFGGVAMSGTTIYLMMTGPIEYSVASMVTTAILMVPFTVWVTNAANFMDGINGITSLSVIICGVWTLFCAAVMSIIRCRFSPSSSLPVFSDSCRGTFRGPAFSGGERWYVAVPPPW
ncbi:MAG: hypothetical protein U1U88_000835 [Lawsonella clevelandensis]